MSLLPGDSIMIKEPDHPERKIALISRAAIFEGLSEHALENFAELAVSIRYAKNEVVFHSHEPCSAFILVEHGLIRVSRYSALGKRLTYLLAGPGEPINLVGPFTGAPRAYVAEAALDSVILSVKRQDFLSFAFANHQLIINIIGILGHAVDSSNTRILDLIEKKVIQRLKRVLYTLSQKFGPTLNFTAVEIAELASTTTESSLRVLTDLRNKGIIGKSRGQIHILKPEALSDAEGEDLWI
jgi:CRP-like cAMP-binding protein